MRNLGEKHVDVTRVDAARHPELDRAGGRLAARHGLDLALHVGGSAGGPFRVPVALEQQQQGVAAELEDVAAVTLGDLDQAVEHGGDRVHELLGALSSTGGEAL